MKIILHSIIVVLLTLVTQIGGLVYLLTIIIIRKKSSIRKWRRLFCFLLLYSTATFIIVPYIAPVFGREKISETSRIKAHSFFYKFANRNYVKPELNNAIQKVASELELENNNIKLVYLDANFPFIDKFPLLPHLSHNDGKKVDISFIYKDSDNKLTNKKPSFSGYGIFEEPDSKEFNQAEYCKSHGYWQYGVTKYVSFGKINKSITFSEEANRVLILKICEQKEVGKVFIEPHLKVRMSLNNEKIRFHGCQAVRHDDHIHFQLK